MLDIRRLFESDARGMPDDILLEEVGTALCARAESYIAVNRAHMDGLAICPDCGCEAPINRNTEIYACTACEWEIPRKEYHLTYKGKQLVGPSVVPFAEMFLKEWESARDAAQKLRAIDRLIHSFHWELLEQTTRPAAINFIDGRLEQIVKFIIELAYGSGREGADQFQRWLDSARRSPWIWEGYGTKKGLEEEIAKRAGNPPEL